MLTARVDLRQVSLLSEIVLRGGDFSHPRSRESLRIQYDSRITTILILPLGSPACFALARHLMS